MIIRQTLLLLALVAVTGFLPVQAAEGVSGTWKLTFAIQSREGAMDVNILFALSESDGKWFADVLDTNLNTQNAEPKMRDVQLQEDRIRFELQLGSQSLQFDGRVASKAEKINGTMGLGTTILTAEAFPSKLKNLKDTFASAKEEFARENTGATKMMGPLAELLRQAEAKKLKVEDVRVITEKANKLSETYGVKWQRFVALRMAELLAAQESMAPLALEQSRIAERLLGNDETISTTIEVYQDLIRIYQSAKKPDEAKKLESQLGRLEARDYQDFLRKFPNFKVEPFAGRKGKSERVALLELFTNADADAAMAAEAAVEAVRTGFKPSESIVLRYHLPGPGPDPLFNRSVLERLQYYGRAAATAPTLSLSGKLLPGGGPMAMAKVKHKSYTEGIEEILEKPITIKLSGTGTRSGDEIKVNVQVADLAKPGEKITLRFALVEEKVRYQGSNGQRYHHAVFRSFLGGATGFPLTKAAGSFDQTAKIPEIRKKIELELEEFRQRNDFDIPDLAIGLQNVYVVAFVQDDESKEVLQAIQIRFEDKKD